MLLGKGEHTSRHHVRRRDMEFVYALVSNFGSLVLRTVFAPVGESRTRTSVRRRRKNLVTLFSCSSDTSRHDRIYRTRVRSTEQFFALKLLYGSKWADSDAVSTLEFYCVFLFFAALNGVFGRTS